MLVPNRGSSQVTEIANQVRSQESSADEPFDSSRSTRQLQYATDWSSSARRSRYLVFRFGTPFSLDALARGTRFCNHPVRFPANNEACQFVGTNVRWPFL